ncbi:MAG TPA: TlpA disulfide reductase family protein [Candidatus Acidoferrum sp.]|jgi:cytochrome c biogenesis protein CcmG/thiol:disulfide interchange protein DsbE
MGILRKFAAWGVLAVAIGVVFLFAMPSYRQGEASIAGTTARDFSLEIEGKPAHLADLKGKVVVLNFWATWCPPCVEETPALNRLQKRIEARNGVVLGVAADEDLAAYEKFLREQGVVFKSYRDPLTRDNHSPIAQSYGTSMYPETYVIDRHGKIARKFVGFQQWDSLEMLAYFDSILGQT